MYSINQDSLTRFSITFYDSSCQEFNIWNSKNNIDTSIKTWKSCICLLTGEKNYACSCTYFRHPYYMYFQNNILLDVIWKSNYL